MKRLTLGSPPRDTEQFKAWAGQALAQIQLASYEDAEIIFDDFEIVGSYTQTRTLTPSTATLTDLVNFVATLVSDMKKRGQNRSYNEV